MRTQQERTHNRYNLHLVDDFTKGGMPIVRASDKAPERLITFCIGTKEKDGFCHFYIDDYRFERLWNQPERYLNALRQYKGAIGPDFSTYTDYPMPLQRWNVYRSKALMQYWQNEGIDVIPNLQWSTDESYGFAFDGLPQGGTVAVSTVGVCRSQQAQRLFVSGVQEAWMQLQFDTLLMYGKAVECHLPEAVMIMHYQNDNHRRVKKWEEEARQAAEVQES